MGTRKILTFIGKLLIIIAATFPIPSGYVLYPTIGSITDMPMWDMFEISYIFGAESNGYWWPLLVAFAIGFLLCVVTKYDPQEYERTPVIRKKFIKCISYLILRIVFWGVMIGFGIILIYFFLLSIYFLLFTDAVVYTGYTIVGLLILAPFIAIGIAYYLNDEE